jgi:hypothetical protein
VTKPNLFPLPSVKPLLRRVAGKAYYAKFDLKKGYLQLSVKEYRHLTAFICELGVFQFNRVPFGLRNAPAGDIEWIPDFDDKANEEG